MRLWLEDRIFFFLRSYHAAGVPTPQEGLRERYQEAELFFRLKDRYATKREARQPSQRACSQYTLGRSTRVSERELLADSTRRLSHPVRTPAAAPRLSLLRGAARLIKLISCGPIKLKLAASANYNFGKALICIFN